MSRAAYTRGCEECGQRAYCHRDRDGLMVCEECEAKAEALDKAANDYVGGASIDEVAKHFNDTIYNDCPLCGGLLAVPMKATYSMRSICTCDDDYRL